jgi:hypothetical protein
MKKTCAFLLLCLLSATIQAATLDLTGLKTDQAATAELVKYFEGLGLEIDAKDDESFLLSFGGYKIVTAANIGTNGDFLTAHITFGGIGKSNGGSNELAKLINRINSRFNYLTAYVDSDGDVVVRYLLHFDKQLEPRHIMKWLRKIESQTDLMSKDYGKEITPFLR